MNFNFFVNIITIFIAIIILKIYFSIFFEKQKAHEYNPFFWIIYLIWQLFFMNCASISSSFKLTLNIILVIFICLYYFIGNIFSKIIVSVLICSIWTIQEFLIGAFFLLIILKYYKFKLCRFSTVQSFNITFSYYFKTIFFK